MGLIKAALGAIGGTLGDQWKDLISCEDMGNDTLMVKKTTSSGQILTSGEHISRFVETQIGGKMLMAFS